MDYIPPVINIRNHIPEETLKRRGSPGVKPMSLITGESMR
jgi:hypothetical protein